MDKNKIKYFRERLLEEKENALNTLKMMEDHHPTDESIREYMQELSFYDNNPSDYSAELTMATMQANLENHQRYRVTQIDEALEKTRDGTYGTCQVCGTDVSEERLELVPETDICTRCAKNRLEPHKSDTDRPVEEEIW